MYIEQALRFGTAQLGATSPTAALDARLLLQFATGLSELELITRHTAVLPAAVWENYQNCLNRRAMHEPVAYIVGEKEFWGLSFKVTPDVLIPRPDTETLVATLLVLMPNRQQPCTIADLGTGSGCLLLSMLSEYPQAQGVGVDISAAALAVAQHNAQRLGLQHQARFVQGSWLAPVNEPVHIVVSNPPYIRAEDYAVLQPDVRQFEPQGALLAAENGLACYRQIVAEAAHRLGSGGILMFEIGFDQQGEVMALLTEDFWHDKTCFKDLAGRDRVIVGIKK